jgi:hypothetical protein
LEGAHLDGAHLEAADLFAAHLEGADLDEAHLEGAVLNEAHLEGKVYTQGDADLERIRRWATDFPAILPPADLRLTFFNPATSLGDIHLGDGTRGTIQVADVRWGGVNLAVVDWSPFTARRAFLGDEQAARNWVAQPFTETAKPKERHARQKRARAEHAVRQHEQHLKRFQAAVRANRQLATTLRDQGMNEEADHFAYRAQVLQRSVFGLQRKRTRQLFSQFLDLIAGYGYKPERSLYAYLTAIGSFAIGFYLAGPLVGLPLSVQGALIFSVASFHGRGFFPTSLHLMLENPLIQLAAVEAFVGLVIEVSFIATFTQRFFAR